MADVVCSFECCSQAFTRADHNVRRGGLFFCCNHCKAAQRLLDYARELLPLKAEGATHRQVGEAMGGFCKQVAAHRWARFRAALPRYPEVELMWQRMQRDLIGPDDTVSFFGKDTTMPGPGEPRSNTDIEKTIEEVLGDLAVPGRVPKVSAERIRDAADTRVKQATRDGALGRAIGGGSR